MNFVGHTTNQALQYSIRALDFTNDKIEGMGRNIIHYVDFNAREGKNNFFKFSMYLIDLGVWIAKGISSAFLSATRGCLNFAATHIQPSAPISEAQVTAAADGAEAFIDQWNEENLRKEAALLYELADQAEAEGDHESAALGRETARYNESLADEIHRRRSAAT